eukprot:NODE_318_length_11118_cov_0.235049.p2 type:complete len:389 gc:universal NODE_318_length_11118_cov_0.235049:7686-8852(+)
MSQMLLLTALNAVLAPKSLKVYCKISEANSPEYFTLPQIDYLIADTPVNLQLFSRKNDKIDISFKIEVPSRSSSGPKRARLANQERLKISAFGELTETLRLHSDDNGYRFEDRNQLVYLNSDKFILECGENEYKYDAPSHQKVTCTAKVNNGFSYSSILDVYMDKNEEFEFNEVSATVQFSHFENLFEIFAETVVPEIGTFSGVIKGKMEWNRVVYEKPLFIEYQDVDKNHYELKFKGYVETDEQLNHLLLTKEEVETLKNAAIEATHHSHSPYSGFPVGCALLGTNGKIYTGCNVENSAFPSSMCAERNALASTKFSELDLRAVAIVAPNMKDGVITPCGACRQSLRQYSSNALVYCFGNKGELLTTSMEEILPHSFGPSSLPKGET